MVYEDSSWHVFVTLDLLRHLSLPSILIIFLSSKRYVDGALSNMMPLSEQRNTITMAPFSGESDICPREGSYNFFEVHYGNVSIQANTGNVYRVCTSFLPPQTWGGFMFRAHDFKAVECTVMFNCLFVFCEAEAGWDMPQRLHGCSLFPERERWDFSTFIFFSISGLHHKVILKHVINQLSQICLQHKIFTAVQW